MIDIGIVHGNKDMAIPVYVGKTLVYVHTDITDVTTDEGSDKVYQYHEYQYDKDEYIELLTRHQSKQDANIDYIAMMSDIELPDIEV